MIAIERSLRRWAWVVVTLAGCGASQAEPAAEATPPVVEETPPAPPPEVVEQAQADEAAGFEAADPSLPEAPWAGAPVNSSEVADGLITAWQDAENREWCAPVAPTSIGEGRARVAEYSGGWSLEFDVRGQPGIRSNGRACGRCGRSAFGVAGTAMRVDEEDPVEAEEHRFRDGSFWRLEPNEEASGSGPVALVASIKIRGQECLYQVWSLAGEEALLELVNSLRFVEVSGSPAQPTE
ncbi:MAG: hypothetical protein AAGF12_06960 [Myxococcota bacterium]